MKKLQIPAPMLALALAALAWALAVGALAAEVTHAPGAIRQAAEDTRDGGVLTPAMLEHVRQHSPGTDVAGCRWHDTGDATVITCDDETYLTVTP